MFYNVPNARIAKNRVAAQSDKSSAARQYSAATLLNSLQWHEYLGQYKHLCVRCIRILLSVFAQRFQKLVYLQLFTDCFMTIFTTLLREPATTEN